MRKSKYTFADLVDDLKAASYNSSKYDPARLDEEAAK